MNIDLSPFAATPTNPNPPSTPDLQAAILDPEVKKVLEAIIAQIRKQVYVKPEFGGSDPFRAAVVADLAGLRQTIIKVNKKLDKDAGVTDTNYEVTCAPPSATAVP